MCQKCDLKKFDKYINTYTKYIDDINGIPYLGYEVNGNTGEWFLILIGEPKFKLKINYCLFCGTKLKGENNAK